MAKLKLKQYAQDAVTEFNSEKDEAEQLKGKTLKAATEIVERAFRKIGDQMTGGEVQASDVLAAIEGAAN